MSPDPLERKDALQDLRSAQTDAGPRPENGFPAAAGAGSPGRLTADTVLRLWSKTTNDQGRPDWSHILPWYRPDVVFEDPIQRLEGFEAFAAMCGRLTGRCRSLRMQIHHIAQDGDLILMDWTMTMSFRWFPGAPVRGCTRLFLHGDGRIMSQRDYYDLWGDIANGVPGYRRLYRWFMRKFFG